jgi:cytochrome c nitrite reductase small subunit
VFAVGFGIALGLGAHTFRYAKGLSYFKIDPAACANCHIMQYEYDGWQHASHHTAAVCIDCHLPRSFFPKYYTKAENGWRHGKMFTLQTFHEPIELTRRARDILLANCVYCHRDVTAEMHPDVSSHTAAQATDCLHCHASVAHGARAALGPPLHYKQEAAAAAAAK